jgi:predicted nucleotidyltransferase
MQTIEKLKATLALHKEELRQKYKVKEIEFFGSYARQEQKKKSDVDVLVTFYETIDLFSFIELENYLSDLLGIKVDLVMKEGIKPRLKEKILSEAIYV